ncbi:MAG TPA: hypothetical protein VMW19_18970 [Myxococcota bacterium]|nr:hypothetical protein [Myxococcota bacterium]
MSVQSSMLRRVSGGARIAALAIAVVAIAGVARTARADSHFENGFEDQLGRILAFEAVQAGKAVLFHGAAVPVPPPAPAYYAPPVPVPVAVPVAVPVVVPRPYYAPVYAVRAPRPVVYYHGHGHGYYHGHHCD